MAAMVNMSNLLNGKDSRWLQLEVCREFQRNKCSRPDTECKFAHPPANVEVQNGRVTACYDSIKGRCQREKPPCKYFHPPQHLKDQLLINGRNHLALKNALMQQMGMAPPTPTPAIIPSPLQPMTANRFLPASNPYNPYFTTGALLPTAIIGPEHAATALASTTPIPQAVPLAAATTNNAVQPQKRTDRIQMFPGMLPYKRPAPDKPTGIPAVYHQPSAAAYQQLIQLQSAQQSAAAAYVPVSCKYKNSNSNHASIANNTIYPNIAPSKNTSNTATIPNANNLHTHSPNLNLYSIACSESNNLNFINQLTMNKTISTAITSISNNNNNDNLNNNNKYTNTIITMTNNNDKMTLQLDKKSNDYFASTINDNIPITSTSTFFADADALFTPTAHQNSINQSSPSSKAIIIPSNLDNIKLAVATSNCTATAVAASDDGDDTENVLSLQNTKNANVNGNGHDANVVVSTSSNGNNTSSSNLELVVEENNNKSINDMSANGIDLSQQNSVVDDVTNATTKTSNVQSSIDESNLNAISFNSATSSSPAVVTTSAIYTTSSITTSNNNIHNNNNNFSNNNSILSRKNSLTMQSQQLINGSSFSTNMSAKASYTNSGKVESVPDLLNASSLNNPHLLSAAVFYNQPYQQLALAAAPSLYSDPAQFAKEMAQKNYANALKFAAVAQSQAGKTPSANSLTYSNPYSGVALSAASTFQPGTSNATPRLPTPIASSTRAPFLPTAAAAAALTRPLQNPYQSHSFIRPQMQHVNLSNAAANPYIAAAAHQQFLNQQNFLYSGLTSPIASPQFTGVVTSNASSHPTPTSFASSVTASYPFGAQSFQAAAAHGLPTSMMKMPQITSQSSQTGSTSAVVLNPYKKMKTS